MIDGRNDNRGATADGKYDQTRDWFYQNVRLKDALVAKGYGINYVWGIGVHSHDMGGAALPEMMAGSGGTIRSRSIRTTRASDLSGPEQPLGLPRLRRPGQIRPGPADATPPRPCSGPVEPTS
jgi:hypothetical protein